MRCGQPQPAGERPVGALQAALERGRYRRVVGPSSDVQLQAGGTGERNRVEREVDA